MIDVTIEPFAVATVSDELWAIYYSFHKKINMDENPEGSVASSAHLRQTMQNQMPIWVIHRWIAFRGSCCPGSFQFSEIPVSR